MTDDEGSRGKPGSPLFLHERRTVLKTMRDRYEPRVYEDNDGVTFDVSVFASGEDGDRYKPVTLDGMRGVLVLTDDGNKVLMSFKGYCVPTGYESPVGWLWAAATMLARIRIACDKDSNRAPTEKEIVALLQQAIVENSQYRPIEHTEVADGED